MAGNLDGIRGARTVHSDEIVEQMYTEINSLKGLGFNELLIRDVVLASELREVLGTDALVSRLILRCEETLAGAQNEWAACLDPGSAEMRKIHIEAKAAQMVVQWTQEILVAGRIAEQTMSHEEDNDNE